MLDRSVGNNAISYIALLSVTTIFAMLAGCGGNDSESGMQPVIEAAGPDRTVSTGFALSDSAECTAGLVLSCRDLGSRMLVEVSAERSLALESLITEVLYDDSEYLIESAQATGEYASLDQSLCLEVLSEPGRAWVAQVPLGGGRRSVEPDRTLASILFRRRNEQVAVKAAAAVPVNSDALCPLVYNSSEQILQLYYVNPGDYDQNGLVSASDMVPLGRNFSLAGPFDFSSAYSVVDGNGNGQIEVADLSVIGQNWGHEINGFNFYGSNEVGDVPVGYTDSSTIQQLGSIELISAEGQPASNRLTFEYSVSGNTAFTMYWARPWAGGTGTEGTCSNLAGPGMVSQLGSTPNALPVARLEVDYPEPDTAPLAVVFDASASSDLDGVIARYEWDYEGDGLYDGYGDAPVVDHTYSSAGEYAPIVRVTDNLGAWAIAQVAAFTVTEPDTPNLVPVADLIATTETCTAPLAVGFLATGSSDPDGYIAGFHWDFDGDGVIDLDSGTDPTVIHLYEVGGTYEAGLTVIDDRGGTDSDTVLIEVVASDDSIVYVNGDSVHAVTGSGTEQWSYSIGTYGTQGYVLAVDQDGTVFASDGDGTLYTLNPDGTLKWDYTVTGSRWWPGLVAGNELYVINVDENYDRSLYAFDTDGTVRWQREDIFSWDLLLLSSGSILTSDVNNNLVSITTDGDLNWEVYIGNPLYYDPIELMDGTIVGVTYGDIGTGQLFIVSQDGTLNFAYTGVSLNNASPATVGNGSIHVGSTNYTLFSVTDAGLTDWKYVTWSAWTWAPTIADTGDISCANTDNILQSFGSTGHLKWSVPGVNFGFALPIYHAGSYYVGASYGVASYGSNGGANWTCDVGETLTSPVMGPDGNLYAASETGLYCVSSDGTELWKCELPAASLGFYNGEVYDIASPSVDTGGTIFSSRRAAGLFAVEPDGSVKWNYQVDGDIETMPAIAASGNIIIGCNTSEVHSISPDGFTNWVYNCDGDVNQALAVDAQDTVYVIYQGASTSELLAIDAAGNLKWAFDLPSYTWSVPVLGDGVLYIPCRDGKLYAIGDVAGP